MGFGEYLSSKAEQDVAKREQAREAWEVENNPQGEIDEMVQIYVAKGMSQEDGMIVAKTLSKYGDFWVEHMMLHEIGMMPPDEDSSGAMIQGVVMFFSFMLLGGLPLVAYVFAELYNGSAAGSLYATVGASSGALFLLGMVKAHAASLPLFREGVSMMVLGLMCAGGAYLIGNNLPSLFD